MDWTLDEIRRAARGGAIALAPEVAGYLMLGAADGMRRVPVRCSLEHGRLRPDGAVTVRGEESSSTSACVELRDGLEKLLAAATSSHAGLLAAARGDECEVTHFARRVEDALLPLNKAAARRQLARLGREMSRRFPDGLPAQFDDEGDDCDDAHSPFPLLESIAPTPTIADAEVAERVAHEEAFRFPTIVPFAALAEPTEESTVRIDSLMARLRSQPLLARKAASEPAPRRDDVPARPRRVEQAPVRRPGESGSRDSDVRQLAASFRVTEERSERQMSRALKVSVGVEASQTPPPVLVEEIDPEHAIADAPQLPRAAKPVVAAALAVALGGLSFVGTTSPEADPASGGECRRTIVVRGAAQDAQVRLLSSSRRGGARIARGPVASFPGAPCDERLDVLVATTNGAWKKLPVGDAVAGEPTTEVTLDADTTK